MEKFSRWAERAKHAVGPAAVVLSGAKDEREVIRMIGAIFNVGESAAMFIHDQIQGKMITPTSQTHARPVHTPPTPDPPPIAPVSDRFSHTCHPESEPPKAAANTNSPRT